MPNWLLRASHPSSNLSNNKDKSPRVGDDRTSPQRTVSGIDTEQFSRSLEPGSQRHDVENDNNPDCLPKMEPQTDIEETNAEIQGSLSLTSHDKGRAILHDEKPFEDLRILDYPTTDPQNPASSPVPLPTSASQPPWEPKQQLKRGIGLEDWWSFVSKHENVMKKRIEAGDARRDYINICNSIRAQLDEFSSLLRRAQTKGFDGVLIRLLEQSSVLLMALGNINKLALEQDTAEERLVEEENALSESSPTILKREEDEIFGMLRRHGFDFPGPPSSAGQPSSSRLLSLEEDLPVEIKNYHNRLREVNELEDQLLLELKHDGKHLYDDTDHFSDRISDNDNTYVVLPEDETRQQILIQQLDQAKRDLLAAKIALPLAAKAEPFNVAVGEGPAMDEFAMRHAMRSPLPAASAHGSVDLTRSLDLAIIPGIRDPNDVLTPDRTDFLHEWLTNQVAESRDDLIHSPDHRQPQFHTASAQSPLSRSPIPSASGQNVMKADPGDVTEATIRWSVRTNPADTPISIASTQSGRHLTIGTHHGRNWGNPSATDPGEEPSTGHQETRSLPETHQRAVFRLAPRVVDRSVWSHPRPPEPQP